MPHWRLGYRFAFLKLKCTSEMMARLRRGGGKTERGKRTRKAENGKRVKISVSASLMGSCWPDNSRARGKTEFQFGQNKANLEQTLVLR